MVREAVAEWLKRNRWRETVLGFYIVKSAPDRWIQLSDTDILIWIQVPVTGHYQPAMISFADPALFKRLTELRATWLKQAKLPTLKQFEKQSRNG